MPHPSSPSSSTDLTASGVAPGAHAEPALVAAVQRIAAEVDAVPLDDLEPINRDIDTVATTVLGAIRQFTPLMPALARLPDFDVDRANKLGDYVAGVLYWGGSATYAVAPKPELAAMVERGIVLRERTLHDLKALVKHGLLPNGLLDGFGGSPAYRKVAHDLIGLSNLVHERWSTIGGKTLTTLEAMDEGVVLATEIMQAIGDRDVSKAEAAADVVRRNQAYTLVIRTYDEIRAALAYVRRAEGDAERFAPTLFAITRSGGKAKAEGAVRAAGGEAAGMDLSSLGPQHTSLIVPDGGGAG